MALANYKTRADDKLHINFSGLKRCTSPGATLSLVRELAGDKTPYDGDIVQFGRRRHEMWEKESKATGRIPSDFAEVYNGSVDFAEHAFAVEIFKDVVLHFRPDAVSLADEAIIDYKKIEGSRPTVLDQQTAHHLRLRLTAIWLQNKQTHLLVRALEQRHYRDFRLPKV
jgi:hypothetical protein